MSSRNSYMMILSLIVLFSAVNFFAFFDSPTTDNQTKEQTVPPLSSGYTSESDFTFEDGVITKYNGTDESVNIPATINGISVTKIGNHAFNREGIKSITIPDSVTKFDVFAFYKCESLESITIPDSIIRVESGAFGYCSSLEQVIFGNGVKHIGDSAFSQCKSLTDVSIPDHVTSIGNHAFNGCTSLKSITIGKGLKNTGDNTFKDCSSLESVTLFDSLEKIGKGVFDGCISLESIVIPDSVTSIGSDIFKNCSSLKCVTMGSGIIEIGGNAFYKCTSLGSIVIPDGVISIGNYAFKECPIKTVVIPNSVMSLGNYTFENCRSLESVTLGNGIETIGMSTFNYCTSLESIVIPNSVKSLDSKAFNCCFSLKSIIIPDSVISLGNSAFNYCSSLESVTIGSGVTSLGAYAFGLCTSLKNITIPDSVTSISNNAFSSCTSLESVIIPDKITVINSSTFYNCSSLKSVIIPDSVTGIDSSAFKGCLSLKSIVIPDSVTGIGSSAFNGCSSLESAIIPAGVTYIHAHAFGECSNLKTVILLGEDVSDFLPEFCSYVVYEEGRTVYMRESVAGENYAGVWGTDVVKTFYSSGIEGTPDFIVEFEDSDNVRLYWYPSPYKIIADGENITDEQLKFSVYYREKGNSEWISYYGDFVPFTGYSDAESILLTNIPERELCEFKVVFYDGFVERAFESRSLDNMSKITWKVSGSDDIVNWVADGNVPVYTGIPSKESTLFTDYTFLGWNPSVNEAAGNMTYTAIFGESARKYTVTFVPGNGEDDIVIVQGYNTGLIKPKNPVREGYTFKGWNSNVPLTVPAEDLIFKAVWNVNLYTVTWSIDGSEFDVDIEYGSRINIPRFNEKEGHAFSDWNIDVPEYMPAENLFIKAQWSVNTYSVTWIVDGTERIDSYGYGSKILRAEDPSKEGYSFAGWSRSVPETMPAEDIIVYAVWGSKTCVVSWTVDGELMASIEVEYGTVPVYPFSEPVKERDSCQSYVFDGWSPKLVPVTGDAEYHAVFTGIPNMYTVTYDANGGTGNVPLSTLLCHGTILRLLPINGIHKGGCVLEGWSTSFSGSAIDELEVKSDVTVYAVWNTVSDQGETQAGLSVSVSFAAALAMMALIVGLIIGRTRLGGRDR